MTIFIVTENQVKEARCLGAFSTREKAIESIKYFPKGCYFGCTTPEYFDLKFDALCSIQYCYTELNGKFFNYTITETLIQ